MSPEEIFDENRRTLFAVAYRMLGSVADAEDMVQEAYLRWRVAPHESIESPRAYLTTVVTRLSIDALRSARAKRETYFGTWLPEPVVADGAPDEPVEMAESLSMAFMVMLESLTPTERAALLLREVFDYEYSEIAEALGKSEANCRQLVRRARERLAERTRRFEVTTEERERVFHEFVDAVSSGNVEGLVGMLAADSTLWSDGGGKAKAAINPIHGPDRIARFLVGIRSKYPDGMGARFVRVNGEPGVVLTLDGHPDSVVTLRLGPSGVEDVYIVRNPDKLAHIVE